MEKECQGCGVRLQSEDPQGLGYVKDPSQVLCQRCYQVKHYGRLDPIHIKQVDGHQVMDQLEGKKGLLVYVVDLFHLIESSIPGLGRRLANRDWICVATKRDILPLTMSQAKITRMLEAFLKSENLKPKAIFVVANYGRDGIDDLRSYLKKVNKPIYFFGNSNVGKSTLLNAITGKKQLTISPVAGTTLDFVELEGDISNLYDSPGISMMDSWIYQVDPAKTKSLQPTKQIKPTTYQLTGQQSLILDGLGYVDFWVEDRASVTLFFPSGLTIHRTKMDKAADQFDRIQKSPGSISLPKDLKTVTLSTETPIDIVVEHAGFIQVKGPVKKIVAHLKPFVSVVVRKAIL